MTRQRTFLRRTGIACLAVVVLFGAGCAALVTQERELTFRPTKEASGWFSGLPSGVEDVWLQVPSGETQQKMHAWYWPQPDANAPVLLYLHGVRWNLTGHLRRIEHLRSFGFSVFAIDYRGFGRSEGDLPSEDSVYEDARAAWKWLAARQPDPARRFIYGHSLGTAVAVQLAVDDAASDGYRGLILEGGFTSLPAAAAALAPSWLPLDLLVTQRFDSLAKIARVHAPILFVHGTGDQMVPSRFSEEMYKAAPEPKRLVLVDGGSHYNSSWVGAEQIRTALNELFSVSGVVVRAAEKTAPATHARPVAAIPVRASAAPQR